MNVTSLVPFAHHNHPQQRSLCRLRPALKVVLPSVATTFFTEQQAHEVFVQGQRDSCQYLASQPHIFFSPDLKRTPHKLTPQQFLPRQQKSVKFSPAFTRSTATMPKPILTYDEKDYNTQSSVKAAFKLSAVDFKDLLEAVKDFIEEHDDYYSTTTRTRFWVNDDWKAMTIRFADEDQRGSQLFSKQRDGFESFNHLAWPEDKQQLVRFYNMFVFPHCLLQTRIQFLCSVLLRQEAAKFYRGSSLKKRKGDADDVSPVQGITPAQKKAKPAAKPVEAALEGAMSTPTRQNMKVAQNASSKHDEPSPESGMGSESEDEEMLTDPEIPAKSSPFKNGNQKFTAVDSVTNAIENEPIFGSLSHTSSDGIDGDSYTTGGTRVLTHDEYMAGPAAHGKGSSNVQDINHLITSNQVHQSAFESRPSSVHAVQQPEQIEQFGENLRPTNPQPHDAVQLSIHNQPDSMAQKPATKLQSPGQSSPSSHRVDHTGSLQSARSAGAPDGQSFPHPTYLWGPFPQANQVAGRQLTPPVSHSSPTLPNNVLSLHSATIVVVFNVNVIGNNVAAVRSVAVPTTTSFDAFFGKIVLNLRDGALAVASATNNCEVKLPDGWKTTFNPREHDVDQIWASIMKKTDSLCAPGRPHMFEIVEVEFR